MPKSRYTVMAVVALLVAACGAAATNPPVVQPTPQVITPGPVVQPTPIVITPGPVVQPTPQVITPEPVVTPAAPAAAVPAVPTGYAELDLALGADKPYAGLKVGIQTQWIGGEGANFVAAFADFAAATGIAISNEGIGSSHEQVLKTRIDGKTPPDLAMLAQPSGVVAYGKDAKLADMSAVLDVAKLKDEHGVTIGLVTDGDNIWGIPYKVDVKSTVWYPIAQFEAKGYKVPTTYQELLDLSDKIVADGSHPWCLAIESGGATGWIATDWVRSESVV